METQNDKERLDFSSTKRVNGETISAIRGGRKIGQILLAFTESNRAVIVDIGVQKEFQGKGIGKQLTDEAISKSVKQGVTEIGVLAQPEYLNILKSKGFVIDGFFATKKMGKDIK